VRATKTAVVRATKTAVVRAIKTPAEMATKTAAKATKMVTAPMHSRMLGNEPEDHLRVMVTEAKLRQPDMDQPGMQQSTITTVDTELPRQQLQRFGQGHLHLHCRLN
jgi:hypothetical protein